MKRLLRFATSCRFSYLDVLLVGIAVQALPHTGGWAFLALLLAAGVLSTYIERKAQGNQA